MLSTWEEFWLLITEKANRPSCERSAENDCHRANHRGFPCVDSFSERVHPQRAGRKIIIGLPLDLQGRDTDATPLVREMIRILHKHFPDIPVEAVDERFTSQLASRTLVESGLKKKARQNKALVDEVSATILLQGYLQSVL